MNPNTSCIIAHLLVDDIVLVIQNLNVDDPFEFGKYKKYLQLQEAISKGPYGARKRTEAQPLVMTADRF